EILREGVNGVQARITITNGMTVSSFAHAKTGYGTPADKFLQKNVDHVGVLGHGKGQAMTIVFRVVIPRNYNYGGPKK
ncbi:hypothetical protein VR46_44715, partial [Streptomyces sp. NRRL S-444]